MNKAGTAPRQELRGGTGGSEAGPLFSMGTNDEQPQAEAEADITDTEAQKSEPEAEAESEEPESTEPDEE